MISYFKHQIIFICNLSPYSHQISFLIFLSFFNKRVTKSKYKIHNKTAKIKYRIEIEEKSNIHKILMWWLLYRVTKEKDPCWRENQMTFKCLDRNGEDFRKGPRAFVFWFFPFFPSKLFQISTNPSYSANYILATTYGLEFAKMQKILNCTC